MPHRAGNELARGRTHPGVSRDAQRALSHDMHREIDRNFAGSLEIEQNGILCRKVLIEVGRYATVDRADSFDAGFQTGDLVDDHIIRQIPIRACESR